MVFENVFANLLNTYLSGFIDDVSSNQLKLGAWKGKVEMKNLSVKENALDSLDLPFKLIHGRVGVLSASIPWSSLYTSPVILKMSNIFVVAMPNVDSRFDAEKEERLAQLTKQKLLESIEEGLKKAKMKESSPTKDQKGKDDDFVTKLTAQIIKNVQIRIENIHVRFEDNFTDPLTPYVAGLTIGQIIFETQSDDYSKLKYSDATADDIIYKLVSLNHLSCYWNIISVRDERDSFVSNLEFADDREDALLSTIACDSNPNPRGLNYLLKPITFTADAIINRKPQVDDYKVPVADFDVNLNDFKVGFTRRQFESLLCLVDSIDRMRLAYPYRRWKPDGCVKGNSRAWWKFAMTAILENEVRKKNKQWTWVHVQGHRKKVKEYQDVYREKLLKPTSVALAERATSLEADLDVFNIILARRQAEASVATQLEQMEAEKREKKKKAGGGWLSSWWGSSEKEPTEGATSSINVIEDLQKEMTQEEKDKLYSAIGYGEETIKATEFPKDFKAHIMTLAIQSITFVIYDDIRSHLLLEMSLQDCLSSFRHRPASNGFEISFSVDDLIVEGMNGRPLIREETPEKAFEVDFVSNPLTGNYDFGLTIKTNPLHLIFDAPTINSLVDIFMKTSAETIQQIQAAAQARIARLKKMSATGLEYAISKHRDVRLDIDCAPFFVVIPHGNMFELSDAVVKDAVIFCLGRMRLESLGVDGKKSLNIRQQQGNQDDILKIAREKAYDSYKLSLSGVQVILSSSRRWKDDIGFSKGKNYSISEENSLLKPIRLDILLQKCIITDDPDLPTFKVTATIPQVSLVSSDVQLLKTLKIAMDLELPNFDKTAEVKAARPLDSVSIGRTLDEPDNLISKMDIFKSPEAKNKSTSEVDGMNPSNLMSTTFKFEVLKANIVFFESAAKSRDCPAVIFNICLMMDIKQRGGQLSLVGKVSDIQLSMTNLRKFLESGDIEAYILRPCDLDFVGMLDSDTKSKRLDVVMDELSLNISPNTVQALVSILSSLAMEPTVDSNLNTSTILGVRPNHLITPKPFDDDDNFWFLKKDVVQAIELSEETAVEVIESPTNSSSRPTDESHDLLMMTITAITIVLENGGISSRPILKMETSLMGRLDGWKTFESSLSLSMDFFNERVMAWEPIIEPVDGSDKKWCTELKAKINVDGGPQVSAILESQERLEVTVSKSFLADATRLGQVFQKAAKKSEKLSKLTDTTHVTNFTGMDIALIVPEAKFTFDGRIVSSEAGYSTLCLHPNEEVILERTAYLSVKSDDQSDLDEGDFIVRMTLEGQEINRNVFLKTKTKRIFELPVISYPSLSIRWLLSVDTPEFGYKKVTFGTPVQIVNNLQRAIDLFRYEPVGDTATKVASVPGNTSWFLPVDVVFSDPDIILFSAGDDYCLPNHGITFRRLEHLGRPILVKCEPKRDGMPAVNLEVVSSATDVLYEYTNRKVAKCVTIEVNPTLILHNLLPLPIRFTLPLTMERTLGPGQKHQLGQFDPQDGMITMTLPDYWGRNWTCNKKIDIRDFDEDDVHVCTFSPEGVQVADSQSSYPKLNLAFSLSKPFPSKPVIGQIFAPFWLINKTGLSIKLKSGDDVWPHPPDSSLPLFFSFKAGKLFKQKLNLQIEDSLWSESFSIDAVGNQGNIVCRSGNGPGRKGITKRPPTLKEERWTTYCVSIDITLSSFALSKIVTFSPFYSVVNRTDIFVEASDDRRTWMPLNKASTISFWPREGNEGLFFLRVNDVVSCPVSLNVSNSALLSVGDELFNVVVDVTGSGVKIQLSDYDDGSCPVRIVNASRHLLEYWQVRPESSTHDRRPSTTASIEMFHKKVLLPNHSVHYLWDEPAGIRQLAFKTTSTENEARIELIQDTFGRLEKDDLYWVSFLDGRQRTLMITPDQDLTTSALQAGEFTKPKVSLEVSMKGLGVSIVNDETLEDLVYLGVSGSDTIWEVRKVKGRRFKALPLKQLEVIEAAYQREIAKRRVTGQEGQSVVLGLAQKLKVDFTNLNEPILLEPIRGILRRFSAPGFWAQVNLSDHIMQFHAKIARVQVDNQTDNCQFAIIMCPVTPPKSMSMDRAPKAFVELSTVFQRTANLNRFKFLSVLVQEFLVQIDGSFLLSMSTFLDKNDVTKTKEVNYEKLITNDLKMVTEVEDINDESEVILSKAYFDVIHFSPIKVHVSFSMGGISPFQVFGVLDLLMRSAGVTLTEFKDVTFRIDFFERNNVLIDYNQLISQAVTHYVRQVLKQFYVIVLGLDVIGNPVGLVMGIKQGVGDFFYEPFLGIIEGPEEFAEGLALGVKSLFSHTVGGAAGALGRITGTIGEGISTLTMDDDFIRRRRLRLQRKQNVADSGKELAQGFWRGLTGIIRKPIEGARDDGFEGLLRGIGVGAVGVIAQPASGVIDFASGSLGALKKVVDINAEAKKQRPARYFQSDGVLRPYNLHEATGHQMLTTIEKGSFLSTDHYITHCTLKHPANPAREVVVLITDVRVFVLKDSCLFNTLDVEWKEDFSDITNIEVNNMSIVKVTLKERRTRLCVINAGNERFLYCQSLEAAQWLLDKLMLAKSSSS